MLLWCRRSIQSRINWAVSPERGCQPTIFLVGAPSAYRNCLGQETLQDALPGTYGKTIFFGNDGANKCKSTDDRTGGDENSIDIRHAAISVARHSVVTAMEQPLAYAAII